MKMAYRYVELKVGGIFFFMPLILVASLLDHLIFLITVCSVRAACEILEKRRYLAAITSTEVL